MKKQLPDSVREAICREHDNAVRILLGNSEFSVKQWLL
jgi:hypothetical protein